MGIVKVSDDMHETLRRCSTALSRSVNSQTEHWLRIGMLAELNPTLSYQEICQLLIRSEGLAAVPDTISEAVSGTVSFGSEAAAA